MRDDPYELDKDYWDDLPPDALEWIKQYERAVKYGNMSILNDLCVRAPSDKYEEIKKEISYERDFYKRNTYTITKKHKSTYTEWSYNWTRPSKIFNKRTEIDADLGIHPDDTNYTMNPFRKGKKK